MYLYIQSQKNPLSELALFWTASLFLCFLKTQSGMIGGVLLSCAKNHWNVIQFEKKIQTMCWNLGLSDAEIYQLKQYYFLNSNLIIVKLVKMGIKPLLVFSIWCGVDIIWPLFMSEFVVELVKWVGCGIPMWMHRCIKG